jgi:REP element-mobilizing transposase RayT
VSDDIDKRQGAYLPHWTKEGASYFVTFRLADSVPSEVADRWKSEREQFQRLRAHSALDPRDDFAWRKLHREAIEAFLDSGKGECILERRENAQIVSNALGFFHGERYLLHAWSIMPNHAHAVVEPLPGHALADILQSWKSFTSHEIGKRMQRKGNIWMIEYYDHLIRDNEDYDRCVRYVITNPANAGLQDWPWFGTGPIEQPGRDAQATHGRDARATASPAASDEQLREAIRVPTDERLWAVAEGLRRGWSVDEINKLSRIDKWFLVKIQNLIAMELRMVRAGEKRITTGREGLELSKLVYEAFEIGFSSPSILDTMGAATEASRWSTRAARSSNRQRRTTTAPSNRRTTLRFPQCPYRRSSSARAK